VLLMVEYVETGVLFWSKLVQEDVEEVVLIESVSEEALLEVRVRREKGLEDEGMVESVDGGLWMVGFVVGWWVEMMMVE
jgi:hypothetical protein